MAKSALVARHQVEVRGKGDIIPNKLKLFFWDLRTVSPSPIRPFGQLKQALGFRQFSLRGLGSLRDEWRLMGMVHNLLKLWRASQAAIVG
jgi:hypothetical protein